MNPELNRLLITEFQGHRLIALPAVLVGVFGLAFYAGDFRWDSTTGFLATVGFFALVFVWGTRQAADCVIQEINAKTWPTQRMSALSAWSMVWAKLVGSTIFTWLGGIVCLGVYAASNREWWDAERVVMSVVLYAVAGILAQTVCFTASLAAIQRRREFGRVQVVAYQFLGLIFALPPLYIGLSVTGGIGLLDLIIWYGYYIPLPRFMLMTMSLFIFWGLIGAWALMRAELREPVAPWIWLAFVAFAMIFFGGLRSIPLGTDAPSMLFDFPSVPSVVLGIGLVLVYLSGLIEPKHRSRLRAWRVSFQRRQWAEVWRAAPRSFLSVPVVAVATAIAALGFADYGPARAGDLHILFAAALLFAVRDMVFIYWMCMGRTDGRGEAVAAVILIAVYVIVPGMMYQMSEHVFAGAAYLGAFFSPHPDTPGAWDVAAPLLEVVALGYVAFRRWRTVSAVPAEDGRPI